MRVGEETVPPHHLALGAGAVPTQTSHLPALGFAVDRIVDDAVPASPSLVKCKDGHPCFARHQLECECALSDVCPRCGNLCTPKSGRCNTLQLVILQSSENTQEREEAPPPRALESQDPLIRCQFPCRPRPAHMGHPGSSCRRTLCPLVTLPFHPPQTPPLRRIRPTSPHHRPGRRAGSWVNHQARSCTATCALSSVCTTSAFPSTLMTVPWSVSHSCTWA